MKKPAWLLALMVLAALLAVPAAPAGAADTDGADVHCVPSTFLVECDDSHATIQDALNHAEDGEAVRIADGTYAEQLTVADADLDVRGQSSSGTILAPPSQIGITILGTADGLHLEALGIDATTAQHGILTNDVVDDVELADLAISGATQRGIHITNTAVATGWDLTDVALDGNATGMRLRGEVYDMTIADSVFNGGEFGLTALETSVADPIVVDGLSVADSEFSNNSFKGLYFEALSNSSFDNIEVLNNAASNVGYAAAAGFDINLKFADYENITISDSVINNNGHANAPFGGGLTIKARDDAPSYSTVPASLDNVAVTNVEVSGNAPDGIRFGEPGKTNAGPTNASVNLSSIENNVGNGLENASVALTDGTCNWWGSASGPGPVGPGTGDEVSANVDYEPWETAEDGPCNGPLPPTPPSKDACKKNGWMAYTDASFRPFKNQGDCVSYAAGGSSSAAG